MTPVAVAATSTLARLRHRRSIRRLTPGQLDDLRRAIAAAQAVGDDRGYQHHAGIHGLPLPFFCTHGSPLFLPWHRAYLYLFERALQDLVAGVTLPWWDWTQGHEEGVPAPYAGAEVAGDANPLFSSPIQPSGREPDGPDHTVRDPGGRGAPPLPSPEQLTEVLALGDFLDFSFALEDIHNGIHVWVGGTMTDIGTAAYDPLFWAHHAMVDRVWRLWQMRHPMVAVPSSLLHRGLSPFGMTVAETLDSNALGYDYAASTAATAGPGR
jgi:tyrosinase